MKTKRIETSITIEASADVVWSILMDFEQYAVWNPFITQLSGVPKLGEQLNAKIAGISFRPIVVEVEQASRFSWQGQLWVKGIFDGKHQFELLPQPDGHTLFKQSEDFSGWLLKLMGKKVLMDTAANFERMNQALKERAERTVESLLV